MKRTRLTLTPVWLEGLLLLTNAIPGLAVVVDCVNCGDDRFATVGDLHDYASTLPAWNQSRRAVYSDLKANDMVMGTEGKVRSKVADVLSKRKPSAVMLVQSTAVRLIGTDLQSLAEDLEQEHGVPMIPTPAPPTDGDWVDAYDQGLATIARYLPFEPEQVPSLRAGLVGHMLTRHEQDELGNVRELERLLSELGLGPQAQWLDGSSWKELPRIFGAKTLLCLPGGSRTAKSVARRSGAEVVATDLPVGLDGTIRWLRSSAQALGCSQSAEKLIERELEQTVPRLDKVVRKALMHRRLGIVGSPDACIGMARYGIELGMVPSLCVVLSMRESEGIRVQGAIEEAGARPRIVVDPEYQPVQDLIGTLRNHQDLDLIVGSGALRDAAKPSGVPYLEVGYPSLVRHALYDAPWWGFRGSLWLAGAMFNRIHEQEYRTFASH